jgi:hypothetical protein
MTRLPRTPATRPASGQVCTIMAFDIDGFTRPDRDEAIRIHLHKAFYEILAGTFEGSGLPWHQCHHEDRGDGALVILRPASRHSPSSTLARSGAELAFVISSYMHHNLVLRHRTLVDPALFSPLKTRVKRTPVSAWIYLPGASQPYLPPASRSCGPGEPDRRRIRPGRHSGDPRQASSGGRQGRGPAEPLTLRPPAARLNAGSRVLNTPGSHLTEGHNDNASAP